MLKIITFQILALTFFGSRVSAQATATQSFITTDQAVEQQRLTTGRNTWNSRFFSNYHYDFTQVCPNCYQQNFPWNVVITPGQPASAVTVKGQAAVGALSIAQIFDQLQSTLDKGKTDPNYKIQAQYDANNGYPTRYTIQNGPNQSVIITSFISNFETVAGSQQELYQNNRNLWTGKRITNYDYQYSELGPNPSNIQWPLYVKVRNGSPVETKDNNGNIVNFLIPLSFDQNFDLINRQLGNGAPYMDNLYNQEKGFAETIFIVQAGTGQNIDTKIFNYRDTNLS